MPAHQHMSLPLVLVVPLTSSCSQEPDLARATTLDLLHRLGELSKTATGNANATNRGASDSVTRELRARPRATTCAEVLAGIGPLEVHAQAAAAGVLGEFLHDRDHGLTPETRARAEAALLGLLDSPHADVRASAVFGLGRGWSMTQPEQVPPAVVTVMRALLDSPMPAHRLMAANAAAWIGPAVEELLPTLRDRFLIDSDAGVRKALLHAFDNVCTSRSTCGLPQGRVRESLSDPDWSVRLFAAVSLGNQPTLEPVTLARLRERANDGAEAGSVRMAALQSFVKHVPDSEDAAAMLRATRTMHSVFEAEHEPHAWFTAIAALAAKAPASPAAKDARSQLETATRSERAELVLAATSGLAHFACATRDVELGRRMAQRLLEALPALRDAARQNTMQAWPGGADRSAIEALGEMAAWTEMRVDANAVREVLQSLEHHEAPWTRSWARMQRQRLP